MAVLCRDRLPKVTADLDRPGPLHPGFVALWKRGTLTCIRRRPPGTTSKISHVRLQNLLLNSKRPEGSISRTRGAVSMDRSGDKTSSLPIARTVLVRPRLRQRFGKLRQIRHDDLSLIAKPQCERGEDGHDALRPIDAGQSSPYMGSRSKRTPSPCATADLAMMFSSAFSEIGVLLT
jgi:hypothetical protein